MWFLPPVQGEKTDFDGECGNLHRPPNLQGSDPFSQQCQAPGNMTNPLETHKVREENSPTVSEMPGLEQS